MEKKIAEMMMKKAPVVKMIMWYTPNVGIVKTEMYNNGSLTSRSEITSIKD